MHGSALLLGRALAQDEETTTIKKRNKDEESETTETVCDGDCCPPNQAQQLFIGLGGLALAIVLFALLPRIIERNAINKGRSPLSARHTGISLALFLASVGLVGIIFAVTGCIAIQMFIWIGVAFTVWLVHGIYALISVR
jgi:hypothetical protein